MIQDLARKLIAGMKASIKRNNFFGLSPEDQKALLAHIAAVEAERDELRDSISSLNQHALPALSLLAERLERERDELAKALENTAYLLDLMRRRPTDRHRLTYTNWRGETSVRELHLCGLYMGSTEWHPERQMLLRAFDWEKDAYRDFAVKDFDFTDALTRLKENSNG